MRRVILVVLLALLLGVTVNGQDYVGQAKSLMERDDVKRALDYVDGHRSEILSEWTGLTEINAPSGKEQGRAALVKKLLDSYKLDRVYVDSAGNVIAIRKGTAGGKGVVFDAHLDTVFQPGLKIKAEIRDGKIYAPGV